MNSKRMEELLEGGILTQWQRGFIESCLGRPSSRWSSRQLGVFARIEENNSPAQVKKAKIWEEAWRSNKERREAFAVASEYYRRTGYYIALTERARNPEYVPTEVEYKKLCENPYAEKVLTNHFANPLFAAGELVQFRALRDRRADPLRSENGCTFRPPPNGIAMVVEVNALPVHHAKKGSKVYKVLPVGAARPYYVLEAALKRARGIGKKKRGIQK
jgi:hypothetical protein